MGVPWGALPPPLKPKKPVPKGREGREVITKPKPSPPSRPPSGGRGSFPPPPSVPGDPDFVSIPISPVQTTVTTIPKKTITKSELVRELRTSARGAYAPQFSSLAEQKRGIDPTKMYEYTSRSGEDRVISGQVASIFLTIEGARIFRKKLEHKRQVSGSISEIQKFPTGTTFTRTNGKFDVNIPESAQLEWSKYFLGETKKLPPVASETSRFGFGIVSSMASIAKPVAGLFGLEKEFGMGITLGASMAIHPYDPKGTVKGFTKGLTKTRYGIHYVSPMDIAFEPIGWSPKGSSELARSDPWFFAGGIGGEVAQVIGMSAAMKPVGKGMRFIGRKVVTSPSVKIGTSKILDIGERVTTKIGQKSPFLQTYLRHPIKQLVTTSPKRFGLKGAMVSTAKITGTGFTGQTGVALQRFGERIGLAKYVGISGEAVYKTPLRGAKDIWVHAGSKTYQNLLKGMTKGAGAVAYDPLTRQLILSVKKRSLSKPFSFGRKVRATKDIFGVGYSYIDEPIKYPIIRSDVWRTGGKVLLPDEVFLGKGYTPQWLSGQLGGTGRMSKGISKVQPLYKGNIITKLDDITRGFHTGGFSQRINITRGEQRLLQFLESAEPAYKPVSKLMPEEILKRFPKTITIPSTSFGKIITPGLMSGLGVGSVKVGTSALGMKRISERRISFKPDIKIGTIRAGLNIRGFKPKFLQGNLSIQDARLSFKPITITTSIQDSLFKQMSATSLDQSLIFETAQATKQKSYGYLLSTPAPFIFPRVGLYGRGRRFPDKDYWSKRFLYREFFVPTLGATSSVVLRTAFKGIDLGLGIPKKKKKKKRK